MLHAVVMAGGSGTRFWPKSRRNRPKQLLRLYGDATMIQQTVGRIAPLVPPGRTRIITGADQAEAVRAQLPDVPPANVVAEPCPRDTAPCVGLAAAIEIQRQKRGWKGYIVTNANCSTIHMTLALKPLQDRFGLDAVMVTTMQAVSGAGYPGVPSLDMIDNVVPYIGGEEDKMETEAQKMLGGWQAGEGFVPAAFAASAQCNRVPVRDGHMECVSVRLREAATPEQVVAAFEEFLSTLTTPPPPTTAPATTAVTTAATTEATTPPTTPATTTG